MISAIGRGLILSTNTLSAFFSMSFWGAVGIFQRPYRLKNVFSQINFVANESAPIVFLCISFASGVVIVEAAYHMNLVVQNYSMVPGFASILIIRELVVVVGCLLLGAKVGAGWAAEVGSMKVTEQLDALEMLGIDSIKFLVSPRLIASVIGSVLLVSIGNVLCLLVAMGVSTLKLDFTAGAYLAASRSFISMQDMYFSMIKAACFGAVIPLISCYFGFRCKPGAEGVGLATTNAVVAISVAIIGLDFVLTWIFSHFY
ncbi:MAG: MlaE family ABC transporter permease [Bdellovibrionales bacterium]